ncbi:large ribosomal subunit protein mL101 (rPPR4)-like [Phragmites australis]|uniref:large ribosomal subunit protein mL101 (rPPR4)-like n=1 Tax=Phragmites australis TaxID=29695 RepID=UPI002D77ACC3|nr:large ribosomal subunit protein mL101 (rPPR4)-like [Phragmites australis]
MATRVKDVARRSSKKYVEEALYRRLFRRGSTPQAVREEVDGFLDSRKRAFKWEVGVCVRRMRRHELFRPALKLSEVMARRGMNPTVSDQAIRLDLVAKSRGIAAAEKYFMDLPETSKTHLTYGALLNCYCKELMMEKAEALMEKMKELNFAFTAMSYNSLMALYTKVNQPEKVPSIIQDMKADDVLPDIFTYNVWMRALAVREDIPGVERVIEEMKRDGRVTPDWTTYSNLASIYVDAGQFEKAEAALKELEKRNTSNDLEAYQFLITLYGRTQNLVEVHRVWRSLKRNCPRMANMSYLNMIQVLANLKDLPAAEACFKEWEARHIHPSKTNTKDFEATKTSTVEPESSTNAPNNQSDVKGTKDKGTENLDVKHPKYDIRVANAMIKAYITEGMFDKAVALKKRAKMRGGRLNAKTWEIFMEHYLKEGDLKMAYWCADRAIKKGHSSGRIWVPPREVTERLMVYFEINKDVDGAEKFVEALKKVQKDLGPLVFEPLIRTYASAGKKFPGMRHRLKIENVEVSEGTARLLESICVD